MKSFKIFAISMLQFTDRASNHPVRSEFRLRKPDLSINIARSGKESCRISHFPNLAMLNLAVFC